MVTFSDCMTLLLTFFVLLISFSSFDEKTFRKMESAFADGLSSIGVLRDLEREALVPRPQIEHHQERERGSEAPTEDGRYESSPGQSLDLLDFQNQKVLLIGSEKMFWGRGLLVSAQGRRLCADIAALIQALPNRVVVSEYGLGADETLDNIGLERAWKVARFLTKRHGLDQTRFSISAGGTVPTETLRASGLFTSSDREERVLEITILDRSTYR
jgi:chemotaxis protein MotB